MKERQKTEEEFNKKADEVLMQNDVVMEIVYEQSHIKKRIYKKPPKQK